MQTVLAAAAAGVSVVQCSHNKPATTIISITATIASWMRRLVVDLQSVVAVDVRHKVVHVVV